MKIAYSKTFEALSGVLWIAYCFLKGSAFFVFILIYGIAVVKFKSEKKPYPYNDEKIPDVNSVLLWARAINSKEPMAHFS